MNSIFVVGAGHTGTSILARLLGAHSRIHAIPGETGFMYRGSREASEQMVQFDKLAGDKTYWLEKTPAHILHVPKILELRPGTKIINMVRDPRDTLCSYLARGLAPKSISRWITHNNAFIAILPDPRLKVVALEALVADAPAVIADILSFLGLPYEDVLNYHEKPVKWYDRVQREERPDASNHRAFRNWQINQPLFKSTVRWPQDLTEAGAAAIKQRRKQVLAVLDSLDTAIVARWVGIREFLQ